MIEELSQIPTYWVTLEDCESLFNDFKSILDKEEPIPPFSDRFPGKLESLLGSVQQTYSGNYLNNTVLDAASSYFNQLIRGHTFENGNKRLAVLYTQWFLIIHNIEFVLTPLEMYHFAVAVAKAAENQIKPEITKEWCKQIIQEYTQKSHSEI